jgi:hypothetical protein
LARMALGAPVRCTGIIIAVAIALAFPGPVSARENRSREVTREFQREHPCPSTGRPSGACPGYLKDHIVPLGAAVPTRYRTSNGKPSPPRRPRTVGKSGRAAVRRAASFGLGHHHV